MNWTRSPYGIRPYIFVRALLRINHFLNKHKLLWWHNIKATFFMCYMSSNHPCWYTVKMSVILHNFHKLIQIKIIKNVITFPKHTWLLHVFESVKWRWSYGNKLLHYLQKILAAKLLEHSQTIFLYNNYGHFC